MAAPRVTIDTLPEKTALSGAEWFIVQDGATSKKVSASHVGTGDTDGGTGGGGVPNGGLTGQVLGKQSNANQDVGWQSPLTGPAGAPGAAGPGLPAGGTIGQVPRKSSTSDYATSWATLTKTDVGLANVDNTADANKPVFTATARGLVPPPGTGSATSFLNANGAWAVPAGSGGGGLPTGGVAGQILGKTGSADYQVGWVTDQVGTGGGGGIDVNGAIDAVAAALVPGNNIDISYNGTVHQITVDVEPLTTADISGLTGAAVMALPVSVSNGGTGVTTLPANNFMQGNGTSAVSAVKTIPTGAVVGTTDVQTLTNKTIPLATNTVSGTLAQFNTNITGGGAVQNVQNATGIWAGTQAAYDALGSWSSTTLYLIT